MKRSTESETFEEFVAAIRRAEAQWLEAWAEGLPMPSSYRLQNPFDGALNGRAANAPSLPPKGP